MNILLDAASMEGYIFQAQDINSDHKCLFEGKSKDTLGSAAPWMFSLHRGSYFANWVAEHAPGKHWGLIIESSADQEEVYRHLRKFLIVEKEDGKELYFRFYDPRVLRVFLPTCDAEQVNEFFESIDSYTMEGEEGKLIRFTASEGVLQRDELTIDLATYLNSKDELTEAKAPVIKSSTPKKRWDF